MPYSLIVCRSLTYAQRTAAVLSAAGVPAHILRTPTGLSPGGCGYSVKVRLHTEALAALHRAGIQPVGIYRAENGGYREVPS